jgi:hypothetical protein
MNCQVKGLNQEHLFSCAFNNAALHAITTYTAPRSVTRTYRRWWESYLVEWLFNLFGNEEVPPLDLRIRGTTAGNAE